MSDTSLITFKTICNFVNELSNLDINPTFGSSSLNLHWAPETTFKFNFGSITRDGYLNTEVANWGTDHIGRVDIGHAYQKKVADMVPGAFVRIYESGSQKVYKGQKMVLLEEAIKSRKQWRQAIEDTMDQIREALS